MVIELKKKLRIIVDLVMFLLFIILMGYHIISDQYHEIPGVCLFLLFILHHILNYKWYKTLLKGKYTFTKILFAILGIFISGVLISAHVFEFLNIPTINFARQLHLFSTAWGFVLMGIHLGLHFKMMLGKSFKKLKNSSLEYFVYLLIFLIILFGVYAFVKNQYWSDMLLLTDFKFFDYDQSLLMFYLEQFAIIFGLSFITYGIISFVNRKESRK